MNINDTERQSPSVAQNRGVTGCSGAPERASEETLAALAALADGMLPDLPAWTAEDYAHAITGSGADKLADSGVAPLVAAARGYKLLDASNVAAELKLMNFKPQSGQGKRMRRSLTAEGQDGMQMPWYSVADIQNAARNQVTPEPFTYQVRPSHPEDNERGKPIKYEFAGGIGTPLDLHPGTPTDWIDGTPVVMFAEGMLKGDAALSAYLRTHGASWDDLRWDGEGDPRQKLAALYENIALPDRVLIVSIAGIYNDKQNPIDWREIVLKDREGWIAFDADLTENLFVHRAAVGLYKYLEEKAKMKTVRVLNPTVTSGDGGSIAKMGVDDFLAKVGSWKRLVSYLSVTFPPAPATDEAEKPGNWRVTKDGFRTEECIPVNAGPNGEQTGVRWEERVDLGGRILAFESVRQPTDQELRTGSFSEEVANSDVVESRVNVEITWWEDGRNRTGIVSGPEKILNYAPADWDRHGGHIPRSLLTHRAWPPKGANGDKWLSAIKAHRRSEVGHTTRWMQMGWVPVEGGNPVFLIGDTVVGDNDLGQNATPGVDENVLDRAPHFGVGDNTYADWTDESYREEVARDFRKVVDTYIFSEAWTEPATAALVLAAGLRPAVPLRPRATCYIYGPKGGGKSWTAQAMMYFWARNRSDWQDQLPGSAKDTFAFLEKVVSLTPIWVVDDLAPSTSKRQAESETAKLEDLTRAIFNNASKGRMNFDMTSMKSNKPISQLVITAENELTTASVKERLIPTYIGKGMLNPSREPTDAINDAARNEGLQARFTVHVITYLRDRAVRKGGWPGLIKWLEDNRSMIKEATRDIMKERGITSANLERSSILAADVSLTFAVLKDMALNLGLEKKYLSLFMNGEGLGAEIIARVSEAYVDNQTAAPGKALVQALSSVLGAGHAHVLSAEDPASPPLGEADGYSNSINFKLGWAVADEKGFLRPKGPTIGSVVSYKGLRIILFTKEAFKVAQLHSPELIPYGHTQQAAWPGVWEEGLTPPSLPRPKSRGSFINTYAHGTGKGRPKGLPVPVDTVVDGVIQE
ncbi:hypothetical protein [Arthrobacter crystallopoietes]|nr:hypothetical protein [Arthrobacter crystallopoietes]AUI52931.1 hypothetical protein AC20117_21200 [Arthrobacter crystallopoietes]